MDKKTKHSIKEIIDDILEIRNKKFNQDVDNIEELHFFKDELPNMTEEQFDNSNYCEELGITQEDVKFADEALHNIEDKKHIEIQQFNKNVNTYSDVWYQYVFEFDKPLIKLNKLLDTNSQIEDINEIEKEMIRIQSKKIITVKEFTKIYNYSADWQKQRRERNPKLGGKLPYNQAGANAQIFYEVSKIEMYFINNNSAI